jgi:hypothetical protein
VNWGVFRPPSGLDNACSVRTVSVFLAFFLTAWLLHADDTAAAGTPTDPPGVAIDVDTWLVGQPGIAQAIVWQAPGGAVKTFPSWTAEEKSFLRKAVQTIADGGSLGLPEAPPPLVDGHTDAPPLIAEQARYAPDLVWRYYVAYLAQSLALEIGGRLPWSLVDYDATQLALLLDSRSLFVWEERTAAYRIPFDLAAATPGDPVRTFRFLRANDLVAGTRRATIERLLEWVRRNLLHFSGDWDAANVFDQWQYYGWPPVERMISGTKLASDPSSDTRHRTGGCLGTGGFLRIVLRTVNVPAEVVVPCPGHGVVHFASEGLYLSHADDLYHSIMHSTPEISVDELFIDRTRFNQWFGGADGHLSITVCKNIGRRVRELTIERLPAEIVASHCRDRVQGKSPAESSVYQPFRFNYSVQDLQKLELWERLEEKVKSLGGCTHIEKKGLSHED